MLWILKNVGTSQTKWVTLLLGDQLYPQALMDEYVHHDEVVPNLKILERQFWK